MNFLLGISSADAITVHPQHEKYRNSLKHERSESRGKTGKHFEYKWGSWRQFKMELKYLNTSDMSVIDSWWDSRAELLLFIESSTATEVHSVMVMNDETPLGSFVKPYDDLYQGTLELETY